MVLLAHVLWNHGKSQKNSSLELPSSIRITRFSEPSGAPKPTADAATLGPARAGARSQRDAGAFTKSKWSTCWIREISVTTSDGAGPEPRTVPSKCVYASALYKLGVRQLEGSKHTAFLVK